MDDGKNILHGNKARIDGTRNFIPRFTNFVAADIPPGSNVPPEANLDFAQREYASYNRITDDADFCRKEVDDNKK